MVKMMKNQGAKLVLPVNESFKTYRPHRDGEEGFEPYLKVGMCGVVWMCVCVFLMFLYVHAFLCISFFCYCVHFFFNQPSHKHLYSYNHTHTHIHIHIQYLRAMQMPVGNTQLFTAHQMCSCRMAATEEEGPVQETGQTWEVPNLYVMDASVFPTSLGINPMVTVEAISFMLSKKLAIKLKGEEAGKLIEAKYCKPTPLEAKGKVTFPEGPTLKGEFGVSW